MPKRRKSADEDLKASIRKTKLTNSFESLFDEQDYAMQVIGNDGFWQDIRYSDSLEDDISSKPLAHHHSADERKDHCVSKAVPCEIDKCSIIWSKRRHANDIGAADFADSLSKAAKANISFVIDLFLANHASQFTLEESAVILDTLFQCIVEIPFSLELLQLVEKLVLSDHFNECTDRFAHALGAHSRNIVKIGSMICLISPYAAHSFYDKFLFGKDAGDFAKDCVKLLNEYRADDYNALSRILQLVCARLSCSALNDSSELQKAMKQLSKRIPKRTFSEAVAVQSHLTFITSILVAHQQPSSKSIFEK